MQQEMELSNMCCGLQGLLAPGLLACQLTASFVKGKKKNRLAFLRKQSREIYVTFLSDCHKGSLKPN